jgi:membrane protein DedA with SNARE-associated domain
MNQFSQILTSHTGLVFFLVSFAEQLGIPVPAAPLLIAAGALTATGASSICPALFWTTAACVMADAFWFYAGYRAKARLSQFFARSGFFRFMPPPTPNIRADLQGLLLLTTAKFLPIGTVVPIRAGTLDISPLRFLLLDVPSSVIYSGTYLLLGFVFHHQVSQLMAILQGLGRVGLLVILLGVSVYAVWEFVRRRRAQSHHARHVEPGNPSPPSHVQGSALIKS